MFVISILLIMFLLILLFAITLLVILRMMFLHMLVILSLVLILNFPIYPTSSKVCQRFCFLEVNDRELEHVNRGGRRSSKDVEI
jgi:hypothetical protein